jgi:acyl-CoA synthetase (AMP-forming)/AMP-acid ligase II
MAEFTFAPLTLASFLDRAAAVFADRIEFGDVPKTSTGKIQKNVLRDRARGLYGYS